MINLSEKKKEFGKGWSKSALTPKNFRRIWKFKYVKFFVERTKEERRREKKATWKT